MRRSIQLASGAFIHLAVLLLLGLVVAVPRPAPAPALRATPLVWTAAAKPPGVADGGGRGGNAARASPAPIQPPAAEAPHFFLPRLPDVLATLELPGVPVAFAAPGASGPGNDTGPAGGRGEGDRGPGSGLRAGAGAGEGEGLFVDGAPGVTSPRVIAERRPEYTQQAMQARAQGTVLLEAVVRADGSVGPVRVVRAMNPSHGLDEQAIEAVRAWRFPPGTYQGRPVAVKVFVELLFSLR